MGPVSCPPSKTTDESDVSAAIGVLRCAIQKVAGARNGYPLGAGGNAKHDTDVEKIAAR